MNDQTRFEIEQFFDGELPEADQLRLAERLESDPDARRYLNRLARLRDLVRRHDQAPMRPRRARWLAIAATAASVVLIARPWDRGVVPPVGRPGVVSGVRRPSPPVDRPTLEVELYRWANTPGRAAGQAARLVLLPGSPAWRRSPADEILALELANASPSARRDLRRFVAAKGSKATPAPRQAAPNSRPKIGEPSA